MVKTVLKTIGNFDILVKVISKKFQTEGNYPHEKYPMANYWAWIQSIETVTVLKPVVKQENLQRLGDKERFGFLFGYFLS